MSENSEWLPDRLRFHWGALILGAIAIPLFYPILRSVAYHTAILSDYEGYNPFIRHIGEWGMVTRPNFLYPLLAYGAHLLLPNKNLIAVQLNVAIFFFVALAILLHTLLVKKDASIRESIVVSVLALMLMIVAPVNIIPLRPGGMYFGYVSITVYHNANIALCRPLALLHFYLTLRLLFKPETISKGQKYVAISLLAILVTLAKPNYALAFVPALGLWLAWQTYRSGNLKGNLRLLLLLSVPFALVILWQYLFTYLFPNPDIEPATVQLMPFAAYRAHALHLIPKLLLSIPFPVAALVLFWNRLKEDRGVIFTTIFWVIGVIITYLLVETGARLSHGNFLWTGQIVQFIMFVVLVLALREGHRAWQEPRWKYWMVGAIFGLHVVCGVVWYYRELTAPMIYW